MKQRNARSARAGVALHVLKPPETKVTTMIPSGRSLSAILKEFAEQLLVVPIPTSEAMHAALFFATAAWNESLGLPDARLGYANVLAPMEAAHPELWQELTSTDASQMIDELLAYKQLHYADDQRRILVCGMINERIRVEWLPPVAPGVDIIWETRLYGLVRTGKRNAAIQHAESAGLTHEEAVQQVNHAAAQLGIA